MTTGLCQCGCRGKTSIAKRTYSCRGWKQGEPVKFISGHNNRIHGFSTRAVRTPEYNSYLNARQRCTNPKHTHYKWYGGRGVKFLFSNFKEFFAELGERPLPKRCYSIDRINNNKHYEVGNVKWATRKDQAANRRPRYV